MFWVRWASSRCSHGCCNPLQWIAVPPTAPCQWRNMPRTRVMKRAISWLALPRPRLLDPRQPCRMLQHAGATWPAHQLVQTPSHTSPTRRTAARRASRRAQTILLRACIAAAQSRVAAPTLSDPRPPPPGPTFTPYRDGHYWCRRYPRRGFASIPGLMRHFTTQRAGTPVDELVPFSSRSNGSLARTPRVEGSEGLAHARATGAPSPQATASWAHWESARPRSHLGASARTASPAAGGEVGLRAPPPPG